MTAITRNLPWFIKDPAVSIIGEKCYTSLIEDLNISDIECIKYSVSKGLGIGIVVGGSIMKVPQLILILRARSARGLSLPSYILETLAYAITLAYSARNGFPFSTYGENLFLTIQNVLITLLIIYHAPSASLTTRSNKTPRLVTAVIASVTTSYLLAIVPSSMLVLLQMATIPLSLLSKFPQIYENQRAKSTGQLSAFAVISQVAGCLARLFTTATEIGDPIVFAGFFLALLLNVVVGLQMIMFWGRDDEDKDVIREKIPLEGIVVPPQSPLPSQTYSTTLHPAPAPAVKRWSRKLD
ncbi:hypothetical protein M422DRAFT_154769 [Sphaerobolus stellatus SS14]|nr:hypothetical protein M422DRAFT_154769 [Sphaerobolus stellatus SS14]